MATLMYIPTPEEREESAERRAFFDTPEKDRYYDKLWEMVRTKVSRHIGNVSESAFIDQEGTN
jgi:hypothetical protein